MVKVRALLVSTYELGRQPFGLASPAAWLRRAGVDVKCLDLSRESFDATLASSDFVGFYLPMHTATRLAVPVIRKIRSLNPSARMCCYGVYAPLNESFLRSLGVHYVLGGEFELELTRLATQESQCVTRNGGDRVPRLRFIAPDRRGLPHPSRYAMLQYRNQKRLTEASRGCKHLCRHCPIVPVYDGTFRVIPLEVVLADIRAQVQQGVEHITFGDPDFFNGIGHALGVIKGVFHEFPNLTYDVTIKVEHLLQYVDQLNLLKETGCVLVTSAFEGFDDVVLAKLRKGHTRAEIDQVVAQCREVGLALAPTFIAFTPWTTLEGYCSFLSEIHRLDLIDHVAPIQLAIRLLIPQGSRLMEMDDVRTHIGPFDPVRLVYPWRHSDLRVDGLCEEVSELVGRHLTADRRTVFARIWDLAHRSDGSRHPVQLKPSRGRTEIPYLNEPWYC